jgi:hypothetical protein
MAPRLQMERSGLGVRKGLSWKSRGVSDLTHFIRKLAQCEPSERSA